MFIFHSALYFIINALCTLSSYSASNQKLFTLSILNKDSNISKTIYIDCETVQSELIPFFTGVAV